MLFADPKQSTVDIVQASGRAMRQLPEKKYGYILIPIEVPDNTNLVQFSESTGFRRVVSIISALSTQDERIAESFRLIHEGRKFLGPIIEFDGAIKGTIDVNLDEISKNLSTYIWERVGKYNYRT